MGSSSNINVAIRIDGIYDVSFFSPTYLCLFTLKKADREGSVALNPDITEQIVQRFEEDSKFTTRRLPVSNIYTRRQKCSYIFLKVYAYFSRYNYLKFLLILLKPFIVLHSTINI